MMLQSSYFFTMKAFSMVMLVSCPQRVIVSLASVLLSPITLRAQDKAVSDSTFNKQAVRSNGCNSTHEAASVDTTIRSQEKLLLQLDKLPVKPTCSTLTYECSKCSTSLADIITFLKKQALSKDRLLEYAPNLVTLIAGLAIGKYVLNAHYTKLSQEIQQLKQEKDKLIQVLGAHEEVYKSVLEQISKHGQIIEKLIELKESPAE